MTAGSRHQFGPIALTVLALPELRQYERMAYELRAVIAAEELLRASTASLPGRLVPLVQGFAMLPLTDEMLRAVAAPDPHDRLPGLQMLPAGFHRILAAWSVRGPLAYV